MKQNEGGGRGNVAFRKGTKFTVTRVYSDADTEDRLCLKTWKQLEERRGNKGLYKPGPEFRICIIRITEL